MERLTKQNAKSQTENNLSVDGLLPRKEKECHITIEKFQLSKVAKAIRDILDFQEEEETTVRIQKVLSRNLKEHLRLVYNITHADLAKMDMADLFQIIARETRVYYSTVAFYIVKKMLVTINNFSASLRNY